MTDPIGEPEPIKGDDTSRATFDQVLFTVTGEGTDLQGVLDAGGGAEQGWFTESGSAKPGSEMTDDSQAGGTGYSYHAWDKWYVSVDINQTALGNWSKAVSEMDELTDALEAANLGLMNVNRLREAKESVDHYVEWLATQRDTLQQWVTKLTSDDSAFKGKAAYALKQNVSSLLDTVDSLHEQIAEERQTSAGLQKAAEAAANFGKGMAAAWSNFSDYLKTVVQDTVNAVRTNVATYMRGKGLFHGTPNYALDVLAMRGREKAEEYITSVVNSYRSDDNLGPAVPEGAVGMLPEHLVFYMPDASVEPNAVPFTPHPLPEGFPVLSGPLGSQSTWNDFNAKISDHVRKQMEPLDEFARQQLDALREGYEQTKSSLEELETPTSTPGGGAGGGTTTPPPFGSMNVPPPGNGGGDLNLPPGNGGGDVNLPPPGNGGGNVDLPSGNGGGNVDLPGGGGNLDSPPANGGGSVNLPPPVGGGANLPSAGGGGLDVPPAAGGGELPSLGAGGGQSPGGGGTPALGGPGGSSTGGPIDIPSPPSGGGVPVVPPNGMAGLPGTSGPGGGSSGTRLPRQVTGTGNDPFDPASPGGSANVPGGAFDPPGGSANLPGGAFDPPGGTANLPGGAFDPPGGTANLPVGGFDPPGGSSELPGAGFDVPGGTSHVSGAGDPANLPGGAFDPPGGTADVPGGAFDPPGGTANLPGGSFDPPGGTGNVPGGAFDPPGGTANLPGGSFDPPGGTGNVPGGAFDPPGGTANLPGGSFDPPGGTANLPGGAFDPPGGTANLPGGGSGSVGGDFSSLPGGGSGGFAGEGWSDWSGQDQTTQEGGPSPSRPVADQRGGMPMMPPMVPPMAGGQNSAKERERQTWLSEDEKVWGTHDVGGTGVIGLPSDLPQETDEPLAPTHVHVSSSAARRTETRPEQTTTAPAEQSATG